MGAVKIFAAILGTVGFLTVFAAVAYAAVAFGAWATKVVSRKLRASGHGQVVNVARTMFNILLFVGLDVLEFVFYVTYYTIKGIFIDIPLALFCWRVPK